MNYKILTAVIAASAVSIGLGVAAEGDSARDGRFSRFDADGDGKVAVSELDEKHKAFIEKADADNDGYITQDEMKTLRDERRSERQARRFPDANGDGAVDWSEYEASAKERFDKLDADGDGSLSQDEMGKGSRDGHKGRRGHH
ncbi:MAG: hypothetical protein R3C51_01280 [Parvularculaceae bacterium]